MSLRFITLFAVVSSAECFNVKSQKPTPVGKLPALTKALALRGGSLPSAELAQTSLGYILLAQALVGKVWTKESMEMYEFTTPLEGPTIEFAQLNYALQVAQGLMLLGKADGVTALAVALFASTGILDGLKAPKWPMVAWVVALLALKHFSEAGSVPEWVLPAALLASAAQGTFMWSSQKAMYQIGAPMSEQADSMAMFVNGAFATFGMYLLGPALGWSSAQTFGAYALLYMAYILKVTLVDGKGLFNSVGGYVWAALFGSAGAISLAA